MQAVGETESHTQNDDSAGTMQITETPRKRKLRKVIAIQEKVIQKQKTQIKRLQKRTSRYKKKIADLKHILENLKEKNYINADHVTQLENLGVKDLMQRYESNVSSGNVTTKKYTQL